MMNINGKLWVCLLILLDRTRSNSYEIRHKSIGGTIVQVVGTIG